MTGCYEAILGEDAHPVRQTVRQSVEQTGDSRKLLITVSVASFLIIVLLIILIAFSS